ncbi:hypothetical protein SAE02_69610 [Skermanella aerolata]|uniref:Uncharacterized protein n=2 Tax=Skermanella aerolata TaxID=393310 RepID=A0A512E251_9PROT|nr:hypothetical protein SAE02_69610 [Skermanella aerolata]
MYRSHHVPGSAGAGLSPRMAGLIADFQHLNTALEEIDHSVDADAWDRAAVARGLALDDLVFEQPTTLTDFAAKMTALVEIMAEQDSELFIFHRLAEDAIKLAGEVAK